MINIGDIDEKKQTLAELFSNGRKYLIPKYQRAFAWSESNVEKFWNDIFDSPSKGDYFLGTIVLSNDGAQMSVIDGQQRLTVVSLIFKALHIVAKENLLESSFPDKKIDVLLKDTEDDDESEYYLLTLGRNNKEFYSNILNVKSITDLETLKPITKSNKRLLSVIKFFVEKLQDGSNKDVNLEQKRIAKHLKIVKNNVFVLEISVPNSAQASKLFEVLNNRGVDLTKADLVRNYLLAKADAEGFFPAVEENWNNIETNVGLDNIEQFFRYSSLSVSTNKDFYERVTEFTEASSSKTSTEFFLKMSLHYKKALDPESWVEEEETTLLLSRFNMLGVSQAYSVIIAAYEKFSIGDLNQIIDHLTKFTFRYSTIAGSNPNKPESLYAELSYLIYTYHVDVSAVIEKINQLWIGDEEFNKKFINKDFKSTRIPRYILWEFERSISTEEKDIVFEAVHLEHIMPKNITKWSKSDPLYTSEFYSKNINKIGNMILLSEKINTTIKNSLFLEKKDAYDASQINMVKEIKANFKWDQPSIDSNAKRYAAAALKIWSK